MDSVARPACCWLIVARHFARHSCAPLSRAPFPFRAPLPLVVPVRCAPWPSPVVGGLVARQGGGGGAPDAGSGPSLWEFPHGGADACTPRQGVTLLYGPSICTRSVQMDLRRNQVRRLFPTPGSGTLWVSGESLRDRHVSCLPQWTVCPTRSPSQDTNRSTCRGECSWSGPLATPPGRCHLGPLANGPGRNPPYCLCSGGADTDTGGAPKPQRSGTSPASFAGSCDPGSPPFVAVFVPAFLLSSPGASPCPAPLAVPPCPRHAPSAPAVCPCSGVLGYFVFFFFLSSPAPLPCPLAVSSLSSPFSWVGGGVGGGGGGVLAVRPIAQARRKHGAGTRRGTCPSAGGGGLAVWLLPSPYPSCGYTPGGPPVGACTARAPCGHGRVVRPALPFLCLPTLPRRPPGGDSASRYRHPPCPLDFPSLPSPLSLVGVGVGGGVGGAPSLPFLRRKHVAGTALARGAALVLVLGSGARRVAPVFALPTLRSLPRCPPRRGLHGACFPWARSCGPSRTLSPPSPLLAVLSSGGGAAVRPSLPASPTLGGSEARGVGGGLSFSLRRSHVTGTRCGIPPQGGGYARWLPLSPFQPYARPPGGPPAGACTARALFGHGRVVRPATAACAGVACRLPLIRTPRPRGGGDGWGGEVCPFCLPSVARTSQARHRHDTVTG